MSRYGIGEWFGEPFATMSTSRRLELAQSALGQSESPICPFKSGGQSCTKAGGVCSLQAYEAEDSRISTPDGPPVVVCPNRFDQYNLIPKWLAEIAGFDEVYIAREVPFMRAAVTGREAGRIDLVLANNGEASDWYGLEVQAVYFSGAGMVPEFERIANDTRKKPPAPVGKRRPDWRSSSAKRLMPQLEVKVPTLRRWGKKLAVAVDMPFLQRYWRSQRATVSRSERGGHHLACPAAGPSSKACQTSLGSSVPGRFKPQAAGRRAGQTGRFRERFAAQVGTSVRTISRCLPVSRRPGCQSDPGPLLGSPFGLWAFAVILSMKSTRSVNSCSLIPFTTLA